MRTAGIILLSLCPVIVGFYMGKREQKRLVDLSYIAGLLQHLQREMCIGKTKLALCFKNYDKTLHADATECFKQREFEKGVATLTLHPDTQRTLLCFFEDLGSGDVTEELARFEKINALIETELTLLEKSVPEKIKVSRALGICAGGMILLLLL